MLLISFFHIFTQSCDSRKIHYLTHEIRVKLPLKTDVTLLASRFVRYRFQRAFNAEFPCQVINYPMEEDTYEYLFRMANAAL